MRDEEALRGALQAAGVSLKPGETWWDCTRRMLLALDAAGYSIRRHNRPMPVRERSPGPVNPSSHHEAISKVAECPFCYAKVGQLCVSMSGLLRGCTTYEAHTRRDRLVQRVYDLAATATPRPKLKLVK